MATIRELEQSSGQSESNWKENNRQNGFPVIPGERELVERAVGGDVESFGNLYIIHSERVKNYVSQRVQLDAAEDLTSQTFLNAFKNIDKYKSSAPFSAWIFRIAHNLIANHYRSRSRHAQISIVEATIMSKDRPDLQDDVEPSDNALRAREALESLIPRQRTALVRRYHEGKSFEEIGQELGIKTNAAKALMNRARNSLRAALKQVDER